MALYLDSLRPLLPDSIRSQLDRALIPEVKSIIDAILRLAVGASAPANGLVPGWDDLQPRAAEIIGNLKRGEVAVSHKRQREEEPAATAKKPRTDSPESVASDPPVFTLHALSVSSPVRKKVNVSVHRSSIRLTNPSTQKEEYAAIPLDAFQRVFLLATRGKSKPHWTVVLLASDTPAPAGKATDATKEAAAPQLVFGLDATLVSPFTTTAYPADGAAKTDSHPKGSASLPALRAFLAHIPLPALEPATSVFRAAAASAGAAVAGVEAYRGAKPGTLWFLREGVLWDGKPCEFFALAHLAPAAKSEQAYDGVRTLTATGRTCSVILRRRRRAPGACADDAEDEAADEDDWEDVDFGMVDGKEQEPIGRWIKTHRHLFGRTTETHAGDGGGGAPQADSKGKGKAKADDPRAEDTEDEEDSDFTMDDSDEESSGDDSDVSGSDASADGDEGGGKGGEEERNTSDEATGDEAEDEEELDPQHHPLLRPGAMPRMSRAAVDAVVGMVEQDLMGSGRKPVHADDESEEEDELED
ncbi:hypothetical protein C2E23DRAFT_722740 [Lenzites betulinus]|nr:hypothetical protein C2E23DRAFT_722740 [Lenzites betulinus]